ncbi:hypothetical protein E5CHR_05126 [Variovorax sp. PBL-E5]|nr:hypothetical protein E5CHR_05126 [Variovorax sp. PBL-E5]
MLIEMANRIAATQVPKVGILTIKMRAGVDAQPIQFVSRLLRLAVKQRENEVLQMGMVTIEAFVSQIQEQRRPHRIAVVQILRGLMHCT